MARERPLQMGIHLTLLVLTKFTVIIVDNTHISIVVLGDFYPYPWNASKLQIMALFKVPVCLKYKYYSRKKGQIFDPFDCAEIKSTGFQFNYLQT